MPFLSTLKDYVTKFLGIDEIVYDQLDDLDDDEERCITVLRLAERFGEHLDRSPTPSEGSSRTPASSSAHSSNVHPLDEELRRTIHRNVLSNVQRANDLREKWRNPRPGETADQRKRDMDRNRIKKATSNANFHLMSGMVFQIFLSFYGVQAAVTSNPPALLKAIQGVVQRDINQNTLSRPASFIQSWYSRLEKPHRSIQSVPSLNLLRNWQERRLLPAPSRSTSSNEPARSYQREASPPQQAMPQQPSGSLLSSSAVSQPIQAPEGAPVLYQEPTQPITAETLGQLHAASGEVQRLASISTATPSTPSSSNEEFHGVSQPRLSQSSSMPIPSSSTLPTQRDSFFSTSSVTLVEEEQRAGNTLSTRSTSIKPTRAFEYSKPAYSLSSNTFYSINHLLTIVLSGAKPPSVLDTFLGTYKCYTTSEAVFAELVSAYDELEEESSKCLSDMIAKWACYFQVGAEEEVVINLGELHHNLGDEQHDSLGEIINLIAKGAPLSRQLKDIEIDLDFLHGDNRYFAEQLTILTSLVFRRTRAIDFLQILGDNHIHGETPLAAFLAFCDSISEWVNKEIMIREGKAREQAKQKIMRVAMETYRLHNFAAVTCMVSTLKELERARVVKPCVFEWADKGETMGGLDFLADECALYWNVIKSMPGNTPCIPCLDAHLSTLQKLFRDVQESCTHDRVSLKHCTALWEELKRLEKLGSLEYKPSHARQELLYLEHHLGVRFYLLDYAVREGERYRVGASKKTWRRPAP